MSLPLPNFYHWSPNSNRKNIIRRGLLPTTPTATVLSATLEGTASVRMYDPEATQKAVCLGTSPSHAWSLSGAIAASPGETWDLWQVTLEDGDLVHPLPFCGRRLDEIRVLNRIPKRRIWHVGTRMVGPQRWSYDESQPCAHENVS